MEAEPLAVADAPQELASPEGAANSLVSMLADLNEGELARLEEPIASRRAKRPSSTASQPRAGPPLAEPTPAHEATRSIEAVEATRVLRPSPILG